ncbi:hypothetical protein MPTK1_3g06940 [Marchantia polymorpha subsp. ruderalis]|uniref:PGG domain-containing protein n=2 Tax=Marchantia polymorpha TaxID=3197 RepID=A0AAF6AY62_MARPO|nr:hypothetical protein MARPO_0006s0168 [Marchantia polymorpha]BBN04696.1 hypothetical protein Mp_3g06940 [Marchantia polymorpha subsp. ruderalis]|eukprot:PTQ48141.1 hypothetical protein MARPO_0006s0168 [Marchantia polymorpha]
MEDWNESSDLSTAAVTISRGRDADERPYLRSDRHRSADVHFAAAGAGSSDGGHEALAGNPAAGTDHHTKSEDPQLLFHAASAGQDEMVRYLLTSASVNVDVKDENGNTALMIAAEEGHTSTMQILLEHGADFKTFNHKGFNCVHEASDKGASGVLKLLFQEDGDDGYLDGRSVPAGPLSVQQVLLREPTKYSMRLQLMEMRSVDDSFTPLHLAAKGKHIQTVVQLLKSYIVVALKMRGFSRHPRPTCMKEFLDLVRKSQSDRSSLILRELKGGDHSPAKEDQYARIRDQLLSYCNEKSDQKEWKDSFLASTTGQSYSKVADEFVDAYVSFLVYTNETDYRRRAFLHYIAENLTDPTSYSCANVESCPIKSILDFPTVDVNVLDVNNETPLHLISRQGFLCMLRHVFESGRTPDLLARNSDGESPGKILWNECREHISAPLPEERDEEEGGEGNVGCASGDSVCRHCASLSFLENNLFKKFLEDKDPDCMQTVADFLLYLREVLEKRKVVEEEAKQHRDRFKEDGHSKGLTPLHYLAYRKHVEPIKGLLRDSKFRRLINRQYNCDGQTALHFAVSGRRIEVVEALLGSKSVLRNVEDKRFRTPCELLSEIVRTSYSSTVKDTEALLLKDEDVKAFMEKQYRDRQVHVDAGNTALVGAALIASVTFAGWLQPPLGYIEYNQFDKEQFAAVEAHASVQLFWLFNSLSFFSAIATVVSGARAVLPAPHSQFIAKEVRHMRRWLVLTSFLLVVSIVCVLGAFTAAGYGTLPPISRYQTLMTVTTVIGGIMCVVVLSIYFLRLIDIFNRDSRRFWSTFARRSANHVKGPKLA